MSWFLAGLKRNWLTGAGGSSLVQSFWKHLALLWVSQEPGKSARPSQPLLPESTCSPAPRCIWDCCLTLAQLHRGYPEPSCGFLSPSPGTCWGLGQAWAEHRGFSLRSFVFLPRESFAPLKQANCLLHHVQCSKSIVYPRSSHPGLGFINQLWLKSPRACLLLFSVFTLTWLDESIQMNGGESLSKENMGGNVNILKYYPLHVLSLSLYIFTIS